VYVRGYFSRVHTSLTFIAIPFLRILGSEAWQYSPALHYISLTDSGEPKSYEEALQVEAKTEWDLTMDDEIASPMENQTWNLVELLESKHALHNKLLYRLKEENDRTMRYKAMLVVKGFQQREGIDFNEIFSPVMKFITIRSVLSIVAAKGLHLEQLDVKTAFLHDDLEEDICML